MARCHDRRNRHKTVKKDTGDHRAEHSRVPILLSGAIRMSVVCAGTCATDSFGRQSDDPTTITAGHLRAVLRLLLFGQHIESVQNLQASAELPGKCVRRSVFRLLSAAWTILVLPAGTLLDVPRSVGSVLPGKKRRLDRAARLRCRPRREHGNEHGGRR